MTDNDIETAQSEEVSRALHFEWLLPVLIKPRKTLVQILQKQNAVWLAPMLVLTVLVLVAVLIAAPIRQAQAQGQSGAVPPNFQYMTTEEQAQFQQGMQVSSGPVFTSVLPAISALCGVWIPWVLLGSLLHLSLTLAGSRANSTATFNLAAWAAVPTGLRAIVQAVFMLSTHQLIASPGLSGFIAPNSGRLMLILSSVLARVDIYFLWMVVLILIGVVPMTGIPRLKARLISVFIMLLLLGLEALPSFVMGLLGNLGSIQPMFFF
jgi:hypothetical protein